MQVDGRDRGRRRRVRRPQQGAAHPRRSNQRLVPRHALYDPENADELANETVAVALNKFRDTNLRRHRWDSTRGATIKTYFIGQCLIRFPNIYRSWLAELHVARRHEL